jgi:hypothetical protein
VWKASKKQDYIYKVADILISSGIRNLPEEMEFDYPLCSEVYRKEFYPVYKSLLSESDISEDV